MQDKLEPLIKFVYRRRKKHAEVKGGHPDEEDLACFLEGSLGEQEKELLKEHLVACQACSEVLALSLNAQAAEAVEMPKDLLLDTQKLLDLKGKSQALEIILRLKDNVFEIINATGDILLGQELIPAPVLRSRNIKDFEKEVTIFKDFKSISLQLKVEKKKREYFNLLVKFLRKQGSASLKELRVTLTRDGLELESYLSESGSVVFENVPLGKYILEVASAEEKLASVLLEINI